jgi:hypothetical protein
MMRRTALYVWIAAVVSLGGLAPALAAPLAQSQVQITSPEINQTVRGVVPIIGSASVPAFQYYKVEYGNGPNPDNWALIDSMMNTPVINGQLVAWNTHAVPDGLYSLRLRAVKQDGNYEEFSVRGIVVANTGPTETPTATPTETPAGGTPTPPAEPTAPSASGAPDPARPTATPDEIISGGELAAATPTPTIGAPPEESTMPLGLDPEGWSQAFVYGALAMGAAIAVLGIVFGVRRLL